MNKIELADLECAIEERAAIMEHMAGMTRANAERRAAESYGFTSWADWGRHKAEAKG